MSFETAGSEAPRIVAADVEATDVAEAAMDPQIALPQAQLAKAQMRHALRLYLGSLAGAVAAVAYGLAFGVSGLDWALFGVFYTVAILGISVGFHRHFSHRSFSAKPWVRVLLATMGSLAGQGSLFYWVTNHRRHHQFSDKPNDVHSPRVQGTRTLGMLEGLWYAQIKFAWDHDISNSLTYTRDLLGTKALRTVNRLYLPIFFAGLALPALIGGLATGSLAGAVSGFLFGSMLRLFVSLQFSNAINSVTHYFGTRPFQTTDESRNNVVIALGTFGEGWHNNHHAFQTSAYIGLRWWQLDVGRLFIQGLALLGLAWNVKRPTADEMAKKKSPPRRQGAG